MQVYLYDLSQGMARALSQQFLGKQIDGIWHTGIVVYGHEYFCSIHTAQRLGSRARDDSMGPG